MSYKTSVDGKHLKYVWIWWLTAIVCLYRYAVVLPHGHFQVSVRRSNEWVHGMLNFLGPNNEEGIRIYQNGKHVGNHTTITQASTSESNGRIVIGRAFTEVDLQYSSVEVDQLLLFNLALNEAEITLLSREDQEKE